MIEKHDSGPLSDVIQISTLAGFDELQRLLAEYEHSLPPELRHGALPDASELRRKYDNDGAAFLARAGERAAGCVLVDALNEPAAVMRRLYISPAYRRRGLARALVVRACDYALSTGYERIVLDTDKEALPDAYALYRSLGFTECEPFATVSYPNPTFLELLLS